MPAGMGTPSSSMTQKTRLERSLDRAGSDKDLQEDAPSPNQSFRYAQPEPCVANSRFPWDKSRRT